MSATHRPHFRQFPTAPRRAPGPGRPADDGPSTDREVDLLGCWQAVGNSQKAAHLQGRLTSPFKQAMR